MQTPSFAPPFDFPLFLSGNFGELRPNHFHGGLDFKTQGVEGKPVHCIEEGYVSRITIAPNGYGNALYVTHPNGYTSVYGHLREFAPSIAQYAQQQQYTQERFEIDLSPQTDALPVKKGEIIAWSGNTGSSLGPHLHMEIRQTDTNEPIDPLPFYREQIKDTKPPHAYAVLFYPQSGKGVVNGLSRKQAIGLAGTKTERLLQHVTAWGEIGLGIRAYDSMNETANTYGVKDVTLFVDSVEVFRSTIDRFSFAENRAINSWTDFDEYRKSRSWYMKSFLPRGNRLRALSAGSERGILHIDEERNYQVCYLLADAHGNTTTCKFVIEGKRQPIPPHQPTGKQLLHWNKVNRVEEPGMQLVIPKGMLYDDAEVTTQVYRDSASLAFTYQLTDKTIPLHAPCPIAIGIRHFASADTARYYVASKWGGKLHYIGGTYENGWVKANISELATYTVGVDTIPPKAVAIRPVATWGRTQRIIYQLSDDQTGIQSYKGKIDGKFVLFTCNLRRRITCDLTKVPVDKGKQHLLELEVTDFCGNTTHERKSFYY